MRTPTKYQRVCDQDFLTQSLKTDSKIEAASLAALVKRQLIAELDARLAGQAPQQTRDAYQATLALAKTHNVKLKTMEDLVAGPVSEVIERIERLQNLDPKAATALFGVQLGNIKIPTTTVTELAAMMDKLRTGDVDTKNERQIRVWKAKWLRAAESFIEAVKEDKSVKDITQQDAFDVRRFWTGKLSGESKITSDYANKHLGYLRQMIDAFYSDAKIDHYLNVFSDIKIEQKPAHERKKKDSRKLEFAPNWISDNVINYEKLAGLNEEARDIVIICAETGCRESEIFDLPETSIMLNARIPHVKVQVEDGIGQKRDVKTSASIRDVPLVGAALEAMKRHPTGFPRYRGNANYYNTAQKFFRTNNLLPSEEHTLGGLRHSYESRMRRAGIDNEERGFMMGHSLKKIRGREIYGDETSLQIRALYAEMVALPYGDWKPRTHEELKAALDKIFKAEGFRTD